MKNAKGLIILLVVFIITTISLGGYIAYDKLLKEESNNKINEEKKNTESKENTTTLVSKLNEEKDWIYDADYEKNANAESYTTNYGETYYVKDIVVPFLNIDSNYANESNQEIKSLFDSAIKKYNEGASDSLSFITCNYEKNIKNDVASVLLTTTIGSGTDLAQSKYYTYNINLNSGQELSYEDAYKIAGLNSTNIDSKVEEAITKTMQEKMESFTAENYEEGTNFDTYNNKSIENYKKSLNDNSLKYFISENNKLNVIVTLNIPIGSEEFDTIISIE